MTFLNHLNDRQREAAEHLDGPLLIVAGAGSGKTRALTYRIANLIARKKAHPWQILAVTFTNKAAGEMHRRVAALLNDYFGELNPKNRPMIGTFHSVCGRILRRHFDKCGRANDFVIYDTTDTLGLMKRIFKDHQIDDNRLKPQVALSLISKQKNVLKGPDETAAAARNFFEKKVAELYKAYRDRLIQNNAVDFDDMILLTVRLFREHPEVLNEFQERWRYLNVDEYQDTNHAQYQLMRLLAAKTRNVCVIGDSDQSIYRFRGADITNILEFNKEYPEAKVVKLEQNYRSTQPILDVADSIISQNKKRPQKTMWTEKKDGELISVWHVANERKEAERVAEDIKIEREAERLSLNDFVVLYRTNAQSRIIEEALLRHGLPYRVIGGVKFYARKEIKDLIAYLRVTHNLYDTESLLRIVNVPPRRVGATTLQNLQAFALSRSMHLAEVLPHLPMVSELNDGAKSALDRFYHNVLAWKDTAKKRDVSDLLRLIVKEIGYEAYLKDGTEEGEMRYENVKELISVAQKYDGLPPDLALATFLEEVALVSDVDALEGARDEAVTLMTLHSVKGLEYPYVYIVGCEENLFPHSRTMLSPEELAEERRLMYVGCTRAMKKLTLVAARQRTLFGDFTANPVSRFLLDIPEHLTEWEGVSAADVALGRMGTMEPDYKISDFSYEEKKASHDFKDGDRVIHQSFGPGLVVSTVGDVLAIVFEDEAVGIKKFAASIAPLQKVQ